MSDYLAGLATLPAIAGAAAVLAAVAYYSRRAIDRLFVNVSRQNRDGDEILIGAIAASPRLYFVRLLPNYVTLVVAFGKQDQERFREVSRAAAKVLYEAPTPTWTPRAGADPS